MNPPEESILVIDDDLAFCTALRNAIVRRGIKCLVAHTYDEAIEEAQAWQPSRAIVDLRLGLSSGLEVLRALLARQPEMRVVVLTGYGDISTAVTAIKLGAINYLSKPAGVDDILAAFESTETVGGQPTLKELEVQHMHKVFAANKGNVSKTARDLGIDRRTLQRRLARLRKDET